MERKKSDFHGKGSGSQEFSARGSQGGPPQRPSGRGSPMGQQQYPQGGRGRAPFPGVPQQFSQGGRGGYYQGGRGGGPQPQYLGRGTAHHRGGGGMGPQQPGQPQQYQYRGRGGPQQSWGGMHHPQQYVGGRGGSAPSSSPARPSSPELHQAIQQSMYPAPRIPQPAEACAASSVEASTSQINVGLAGLLEGAERNDSGTNNTMIKILTYNVWFREDIEVHKRMKALGDLIQQYLPEIICFQEVTPYIYELFQDSAWWSMYKCSLTRNMVDCRPYFCMQMSKFSETSFKCKQFNNSVMGRELLIAEIDLQPNKKLTVATTHLESPAPAPPTWNQMYSKERIAQAKESIETLKIYPNVVFGGDMNWNDKQDGDFPLTSGWIDAWSELRSGEDGWTYDTVSNGMLTGGRRFQTRLDRFVCCLKDFRVVGIEMIGKDAVPGGLYVKEKKVKNGVRKLELPVLPSDHYGLLLTVQTV